MRVYIGHDAREQAAWDVAAKTARSFGCDAIPVYEDRLRATGMLTRPVDRRVGMWDFNSSAPQSTEFAISRFAVPILAHSGWVLGVDCDVVFLRDPRNLQAIADPSKAVQVVQHPPLDVGGKKMDGAIQTNYNRKFWSSVILWNLEHPANRRLNLSMLNQLPGRELHQFAWLADDEIGTLPPEWNHLVGINKPRHKDALALLHFTLGTPNMPGYEDCEYSTIWTEASLR